jgi:hypothetical protein
MTPGAAAAPIGASFGWWVGAVHALLALSWTAYVLFLPSFVTRVGLPASIVIWIVLLDQALFAVTDWASAVLADRVAQVWRRLGAAIAAAALLCGLLFAALPWAAAAGSSGLLLVLSGPGRRSLPSCARPCWRCWGMSAAPRARAGRSAWRSGS